MAIRYLGSKGRVAAEILDLIGCPIRGGVFVDLFAGTGSVSRVAASRGWEVRANDILPSAAILTRAQLTTSDEARFDVFGGYAAAISALNSAPPRTGFFAREYSPLSATEATNLRRYFTVSNARQIDGMRHIVSEWAAHGLLKESEFALLLADLIEATNAVANTAGTYGCFLRGMDPRAENAVKVIPRTLLVRRSKIEVRTGDAGSVPSAPGDVVYLDPPYTKRQYAAYYHILETLVAGDEPLVTGVTGLRPWKDRASDFCYKTRALGALSGLVNKIKAARILISYSEDGHISIGDMEAAMRAFGTVHIHSLGPVPRYISNVMSAASHPTVREVLVEVVRPSHSKATQSTVASCQG